jgi:hypothetical protein
MRFEQHRGGMSLRNERVAAACFAAVVVIYAAVCFTHTCEVAGGSDSSGYANEARAIGRGHIEERITELDRFDLDDSFTAAFSVLGYTPAKTPRYATPSYPPGLPMHMALAGWLFGWKHAPFYVIPLSAIIGLILIGLFAHRLFGSWWIAIGAGVSLGVCATYIFMGLQPMSDVLVTAWSIAAIAGAWRAGTLACRDDGQAGGPDVHWAAVAGACAAVTVWVRPSNVLIGFALLAALPFTKKAIAWCAAGGAVVVAPLLVWNARRYGSPFRTGYGDIGGLLEWRNFPSHSIHYLWWTVAILTPLVWIGAIYSLVRARRERIHLVLALWFWPFYIFYVFYGPYETWWYTRFLLPAYPALILSTIYAARAVGKRALIATFCAMALTSVYLIVHWDLLNFREGESIYPDVVRWAEPEIPPDGLVIAMQFSGARKYYKNHFSLRWDYLDADRVKVVEQKVPPDRWYAILSEFEVNDALSRMGGRWAVLGQYREVMLLHRDPNGTLPSNK